MASSNRDRQRMDDALKAHFTPGLREAGFVGSMPYLQRRLPDRVDFLMVQFNKYGGSFTVELGQTGPHGLTEWRGPEQPVERTRVWMLPDRLRRRVTHGLLRHQWFRFAPGPLGMKRPAKPQAHYDAVARKALVAFRRSGEAWLAKEPARGQRMSQS